MPRHRQTRLIPIAEAARLSQRPPADLRRWCATGRLRCERVGGNWFMLEDDLHVAASMTDVAARSGGPAVLSIAFPNETDGRRAFEQLRTRYRLGPGDLGIAPLALDGADLVLVAGVFPPGSLDEVLDIAGTLGGVIVDGVAESRITPEHWGRENEQGESSYG